MERQSLGPLEGETTQEQAEELLEEGIPIAKLPWSSRRCLSMKNLSKKNLRIGSF